MPTGRKPPVGHPVEVYDGVTARHVTDAAAVDHPDGGAFGQDLIGLGGEMDSLFQLRDIVAVVAQ